MARKDQIDRKEVISLAWNNGYPTASENIIIQAMLQEN